MNLGLLIIIAIVTLTNAQTALMFGATGAVGSEVLGAILNPQFGSWEKVILVSRRFPLKLTNLLDENKDTDIVRIQLPDLSNIDDHNELQSMKIDSCFIAVGVGEPYNLSLSKWLSIEVDIVASMARLCNKMNAQSVTLLSSADAEIDPKVFDSVEVNENYGMTPIGWIGMLAQYTRVMGLKESGIIEASRKVSMIRIFQPSTIITTESRYGWFDWIMFRLHFFLDYVIPEKYHSIDVKSLGMAMVVDAHDILKSLSVESSLGGSSDVSRVSRLTFGDYLHILEGTGEQIEKSHGMEKKIRSDL